MESSPSLQSISFDDDAAGSDRTALWLALHPITYLPPSARLRYPIDPPRPFPLHSSGRLQTCRLTVLLGSGGHTGEMIRLLSDLPFDRYTPRTYVISSADALSMSKAIELERIKPVGQYTFLEIPRARRVNHHFPRAYLQRSTRF
ncbi:hypothetical protein KEM48_011076 [Puccinia striiformis f. sp. tritici PST-130]|nr:hypothetical protein KEM48_011076 [Puccinia striiformis f. sp. tritici PST-130]